MSLEIETLPDNQQQHGNSQRCSSLARKWISWQPKLSELRVPSHKCPHPLAEVNTSSDFRRARSVSLIVVVTANSPSFLGIDPAKYHKTEEVAQFIEVNPETLRHWRHKHKGPSPSSLRDTSFTIPARLYWTGLRITGMSLTMRTRRRFS
jgi:hypothetical protein